MNGYEVSFWYDPQVPSGRMPLSPGEMRPYLNAVRSTDSVEVGYETLFHMCACVVVVRKYYCWRSSSSGIIPVTYIMPNNILCHTSSDSLFLGSPYHHKGWTISNWAVPTLTSIQSGELQLDRIDGFSRGTTRCGNFLADRRSSNAMNTAMGTSRAQNDSLGLSF